MNRIMKQITEQEAEQFLTKKELLEKLNIYGTRLSVNSHANIFTKPSSYIYNDMIMIIGEDYTQLYPLKEYVGLTENNTLQEIFSNRQVAEIRSILYRESAKKYFVDDSGVKREYYMFYSKDFFLDIETCLAYHLTFNKNKLSINPSTYELKLDTREVTNDDEENSELYMKLPLYGVIMESRFKKILSAYNKKYNS